jgi:hypothetical protein
LFDVTVPLAFSHGGEDLRLRVFENRVLKKEFGSRRNDIIGMQENV